MDTFTQILYQIVFSTKNRGKTLTKEGYPPFCAYVWGILKNKKCHLYRIGGVEDHIHLVLSVHPSVAVADLVKDIKLSSSAFIKENAVFPHFRGWQEGYGAFTYSIAAKDALIEYVKNQEQHHKGTLFKDELKGLLQEHQVTFEEKYLD